MAGSTNSLCQATVATGSSSRLETTAFAEVAGKRGALDAWQGSVPVGKEAETRAALGARADGGQAAVGRQSAAAAKPGPEKRHLQAICKWVDGPSLSKTCADKTRDRWSPQLKLLLGPRSEWRTGDAHQLGLRVGEGQIEECQLPTCSWSSGATRGAGVESTQSRSVREIHEALAAGAIVEHIYRVQAKHRPKEAKLNNEVAAPRNPKISICFAAAGGGASELRALSAALLRAHSQAALNTRTLLEVVFADATPGYMQKVGIEALMRELKDLVAPKVQLSWVVQDDAAAFPPAKDGILLILDSVIRDNRQPWGARTDAWSAGIIRRFESAGTASIVNSSHALTRPADAQGPERNIVVHKVRLRGHDYEVTVPKNADGEAVVARSFAFPTSYKLRHPESEFGQIYLGVLTGRFDPGTNAPTLYLDT